MPSSRIKENGLKIIEEHPDLVTNIRGMVADSDQVSGYPSDGQAANVSKETTIREILEIDGVEKDLFKLQNINILFGQVNALEYCNKMFNFPTMQELAKKIETS